MLTFLPNVTFKNDKSRESENDYFLTPVFKGPLTHEACVNNVMYFILQRCMQWLLISAESLNEVILKSYLFMTTGNFLE